MGKVLDTKPCPRCRENGKDNSGDNLQVYADGAKCFACGYYESDDEGETSSKPKAKGKAKFVTGGAYQELPERGLYEETLKKFKVRVRDEDVLFPYLQDGELVGQKVRSPGKKFKLAKTVEAKEFPLFGSQLWNPNPKLNIVLTEGEFDAMAVSQVQQHKWPVVSVPHGAAQAVEAVRHNMEYLQGFKEVVVCFDEDSPGRNAAKAVAEVLPPGKCRITSLPAKDANEMVKAGKLSELVDSLRNAKQYRPDGVVDVCDVEVDIENIVGEIYDYPYQFLNEKLLGKRSGELVVVTAGSGCGKTTFVKELMHHDLLCGRKVGCLLLEESVDDTKLDMASIHLSAPLRKQLALERINDKREADGLHPVPLQITTKTHEDMRRGLRYVDEQPLCLYNHWGSLDSEVLLNKIRYMVGSLGCQVVYLDHLSIAVSGVDTHDERKLIDVLMTKLRSMVEELGFHLCVVSHLRKVGDGTSYEDGGRISADALRGSGSIKQLANGIIAIQRSQRDAEGDRDHRVHLHSLKDRFGGYEGPLGSLEYSPATGRSSEILTDSWEE